MPTDPFGNELGIDADGTTTFNGRTMSDYVSAGELPAGYYQDPEGAIRQQEGDFTGTRGFFGANHSLADFENGRIVRFHTGGEIPGPSGQGGAGRPQAPYNPLAKAGTAFALADVVKNALEQLVSLASK